MKTFDEIRDLLALKLRVEKKRLKTFGTKTDSYQMANVLTRYVQALMATSRSRELKKLLKFCKKKKIYPHAVLSNYIRERVKVTEQMSKAIEHFAEEADKKRPWKSTVKKGRKKEK